jgi:hypothetical protein
MATFYRNPALPRSLKHAVVFVSKTFTSYFFNSTRAGSVLKNAGLGFILWAHALAGVGAYLVKLKSLLGSGLQA